MNAKVMMLKLFAFLWCIGEQEVACSPKIVAMWRPTLTLAEFRKATINGYGIKIVEATIILAISEGLQGNKIAIELLLLLIYLPYFSLQSNNECWITSSQTHSSQETCPNAISLSNTWCRYTRWDSEGSISARSISARSSSTSYNIRQKKDAV
jgi:hypothetical protein